ncbi:lipid-A-disaccharide synthase [soil metagenome]
MHNKTKLVVLGVMKQNYKILIVAGEPSGDAHAAKLVNALRENCPAINFEFFGAVSHQMREAGVETIINADDFSIVGLPEIARALPMFWQAFRKIKKAAVKRQTDAVILVDFPDFNLKLAKSLKKEGLKIIYYISPQLWAWRKHRVKIIAKYVDLLLTILPFEKDWYKKQGILHVEYVGSPLASEVYAQLSRREFCEKHQLDSAKPIIALLAGSRHKEIVRILPVMLETASLMAEKKQDLQFIIALSSTRKFSEIETAAGKVKAKGLKLPETLITVRGETCEVLNAADVAAVTSGTATLETAIIGTPMAIVYKTSSLNYKLLRPLISVEHFGLINLIAQERLAAELIQDDFTKETLSEELFCLLEPKANENMREKLREVTKTLGHGGASKRAAQAILREMEIFC